MCSSLEVQRQSFSLYSGRRLIGTRLNGTAAYLGQKFRVRIFHYMLCISKKPVNRDNPPLYRDKIALTKLQNVSYIGIKVIKHGQNCQLFIEMR